MTEPTHPRRVVCAANKETTTGWVFLGARHFDSAMTMQMRLANVKLSANFEQGFIDQDGIFMSREEALTVAIAAGQRIYRCGGDEKKLYSENLY